MFMRYDLKIDVRRSDMISLEQAAAMEPDYILISPGPRDPDHAGISIPLVKTFYNSIPILGICLGMQCINEAFGGATVRAPFPVHGKTSEITHNNHGIFKGIASPFTVARYHSLMTANIYDHLEISSRSDDGVIMGFSHTKFPVHGLQFHPESFLTENGFLIVENFLRLGPLGDFN